MQLKLGLKTAETVQPLVLAQEMVARTRNMHIDCMCISCAECAAQLIAFWRDAYDDSRPSKVSSVILDAICTLTIDVKALLHPFMPSKLGVTSCELILHEDDQRGFSDDMKAKLGALWSAWDGCSGQSLKLYPSCPESFVYLIDRMLAEPDHGGRHYSLVGIEMEVQQVVDNYIDVGFRSLEMSYQAS